MGLYILKLDKKNGRMIIGGEPYNYNETFVKELHNQKEALPYHTFEFEYADDNEIKKETLQ